jgi:hypothetical protein
MIHRPKIMSDVFAKNLEQPMLYTVWSKISGGAWVTEGNFEKEKDAINHKKKLDKIGEKTRITAVPDRGWEFVKD